MPEYIEREAAIKSVEYVALIEPNEFDIVAATLKTARFKISKIPPADVALVRHGHWEEKDDNWFQTYYECSVCKECYCLQGASPLENGYKYCPYCWTKMDEEANT